MRLLLVEDDHRTADYIVRGLTEAGHVCDLVRDGHDALFAATSGAYDVIIADRMIPGLDGLSMVKPSKVISECIHLPLRGAGAAAAQAPKNEETNGRRCKPRPRSVPPMPLGEQRWQRPTGKADLAHIPSPREYEREVRRRRRRPIRTPL